jgi:hypothetical protein
VTSSPKATKSFVSQCYPAGSIGRQWRCIFWKRRTVQTRCGEFTILWPILATELSKTNERWPAGPPSTTKGTSRITPSHAKTLTPLRGSFFVWIAMGRRPSRGEGCAGKPALAGSPRSSAAACAPLCRPARSSRPLRAGDPPPGHRPSPCYPRSRRRAGVHARTLRRTPKVRRQK